MRTRFLLILLLSGLSLGGRAAVLPPEKLLPKDTALMVTMPDSAAAWILLTNTPCGRLWQDAQLKAFKDKFVDKFTGNVISPLEQTLGLKFSDYKGLARGQATFALLPMTQTDRPDDHFARLFLLDTKDHAAQLRTNLADIKQKWAAAGKPMKTLRIRELDFTTFIVGADDLSWDKITAKPKGTAAENEAADKPSTNKIEITFGQSDSLLLVSDSPAVLEKVLSRQAGGLVPALEEEPTFQTDFAARLHGAPFYAWANIKGVIDTLIKTPAGATKDSGPVAAARPDSMLTSAGLTGLTSACLSYRNVPEGLSAQIYIGAPEAARRGLLKAFVNETKDASPPVFVPADAAKYWRWRIDIPRTWTQLETMLNELNPQYGNVINFVLQSAGKDRDEKYDLKSQLLGNLGDDIIHYEKAPRGNTPSDLSSAPSLYLIGSPNPEKLAAAIKTGLSIMGTAKDREFLGRQICTITTTAQNGTPAHSFSFAGSGAYVALSDESGILEEYLRNNDNKSKALAETPGLADAAQKVGGMGTGLFGFDNQGMNMRALVEMLRTQPVTLQDIVGSSSMPGINPADQVAKLREWADFSLLPPYDSIAQYFYFSVYAGTFSPDGFTLNLFSPTPPKLR
jgi:hypothetical protein